MRELDVLPYSSVTGKKIPLLFPIRGMLMPITESKCEFPENPGFNCAYGPRERKFSTTQRSKNLIFLYYELQLRIIGGHPFCFMVKSEAELSQVNSSSHGYSLTCIHKSV